MLDLRTRTTAELDPGTLTAARALLDGAFGGRFDDHDWHHTLGGQHVHGFVDGTLVAHASVVPRTLWCADTALRAGYVEGVAVDAAHRRRGYGAAIMAVVNQLIVGAYDLGALSAGEEAQRLYHRMGWLTWLGPSHVEAASGRVATPDEDGYILVLPTFELDLTAAITCDRREGDFW